MLSSCVRAEDMPVRGRYRLEDLAAAMPKDYLPGEADWGREGSEVW